jgi:phosphonate transport system substrate-binding protein
MVERRQFLKSSAIATTIGLAGCLGDGGEEEDPGSNGSDSTPTDSPTASPTPEPYGDGTLDFFMSPSEPQDLMVSQYDPIEKYLTEEVHDTELTYAKNYSAVIESLGTGTGDIAETGPFAAALGVNEDKVDVILQRFAYGSWEYTSVLVTKEGSGITSVSDLEGKTIALADRLSASGSLYPLDTLKNAGLSIGDLPTGSDANADFTAQYAGGHGAAFEALANGQVDAAGVGKFITVDGEDRTLKDGYSYVEKRTGIPRAPIVASPQLSEENKQAVTDAFVNAPDSMYLGADGEADTEDDLWFSDVRESSVEDYQDVVKVATNLGISLDQL